MLESKESFSKLTNFFVLLKIVKQFYIDFFINIFVKKNNNNIYLLQISTINNNKNKDNFIAYRLNYNCKDFNII